MFTKSSPPGPYFKPNISPKKVGKQGKIKTYKGERRKPTQRNTNDGREKLPFSYDDALRCKFPLNELARLLAP